MLQVPGVGRVPELHEPDQRGQGGAGAADRLDVCARGARTAREGRGGHRHWLLHRERQQRCPGVLQQEGQVRHR